MQTRDAGNIEDALTNLFLSAPVNDVKKGILESRANECAAP